MAQMVRNSPLFRHIQSEMFYMVYNIVLLSFRQPSLHQKCFAIAKTYCDKHLPQDDHPLTEYHIHVSSHVSIQRIIGELKFLDSLQ